MWYAVVRVGVGAIQAKRGRGGVTIDGKAGAGERRRPERTSVEPRPSIGEARDIAAEHLIISHEMMAQRHRLGDLEVREAGHHRLGMLLGAPHRRPLEAVQRSEEHTAELQYLMRNSY